jgi:hypothetical protein
MVAGVSQSFAHPTAAVDTRMTADTLPLRPFKRTNRAGGLTYTNPAATDAVSYYKIASGNPITFGWNYTSL